MVSKEGNRMKRKIKWLSILFSILLVIMPFLTTIQPKLSTSMYDSDAPLKKRFDYIDIIGFPSFQSAANGGGTGTPGDPFIIENLTLDLSGYDNGISIFGTGYHFIIRNCHFIGDGDESGILITDAANGTIYNNSMTNFRYGITIKGATNVNITQNNLTQNNWRGLELYYILAPSYFIRVINNTMVGNVLQSGCRVEWVYNCTFINNTCNNNGAKGFWLANSESNIVINNTAINNGDYGFLIEDSHYNNFTHNTAIGNPLDGFRVSDSIQNRFYQNTAEGNTEYGFQLLNATHSTLTNNTILNNGGHGILLTYYSSYNTITLNTIHGNGEDCIYESPTCVGNTIANNDCDQSSDGIPGFQWLISLLGLSLAILILLAVMQKRRYQQQKDTGILYSKIFN